MLRFRDQNRQRESRTRFAIGSATLMLTAELCRDHRRRQHRQSASSSLASDVNAKWTFPRAVVRESSGVVSQTKSAINSALEVASPGFNSSATQSLPLPPAEAERRLTRNPDRVNVIRNPSATFFTRVEHRRAPLRWSLRGIERSVLRHGHRFDRSRHCGQGGRRRDRARSRITSRSRPAPTRGSIETTSKPRSPDTRRLLSSACSTSSASCPSKASQEAREVVQNRPARGRWCCPCDRGCREEAGRASRSDHRESRAQSPRRRAAAASERRLEVVLRLRSHLMRRADRLPRSRAVTAGAADTRRREQRSPFRVRVERRGGGRLQAHDPRAKAPGLASETSPGRRARAKAARFHRVA